MDVLIKMLVRMAKKNFLSLVIVGGCIMFAMNVYKEKQAEIDGIVQNKELELKKNEVLQEISLLEKNYNQLKAQINKKDKANSAIMFALSSIAKDANIKVSYIRPVGEEKTAVFSRAVFEVSLASPDYHKIGKFVSAIESAPELFTVEDFEVTGAGEESLSARLTVSTVMVK